jgi:hypothetical protein
VQDIGRCDGCSFTISTDAVDRLRALCNCFVEELHEFFMVDPFEIARKHLNKKLFRGSIRVGALSANFFVQCFFLNTVVVKPAVVWRGSEPSLTPCFY